MTLPRTLKSMYVLFINSAIQTVQFFKKNYRNYYDDRSWWDEVGSKEK